MTKKKPSKKTSKPDEPTFEQAMQEAEAIVRELELGGVELSESLHKYERGIGLLSRCFRHLEEAEFRIKQLAGFDASGEATLTDVHEVDELSLEEKARTRSRRRTARTQPTENQPEGGAPDGGSSAPKRRQTRRSSAPPENQGGQNSVDETQGLF